MLNDDTSYVPTLAVRPSEMNGLEYLPSKTKSRMLPCFLLAPWANSKTLDRALERIHRAFPNRKFFLDIDLDYNFSNLEIESQIEFAKLQDLRKSGLHWVEFIECSDWIIPCVQTRGQTENEIRNQIERIRKLGRTFCMRIERSRFPSNLDEVVAAFKVGGTADFAIILEGGWARDPLTLEAWFTGVIQGSLREFGQNVPIVVSSTSMPKNFSSIEGVELFPYGSRVLFDNISRRWANLFRLVYGDWGSTRPRERPSFATCPLPRIDYPIDDALCIARSKKNEWDYKDAAVEIVNCTCRWDGKLGVWGEEMIQKTAINSHFGIDTPQKNVASRVNIHLHLQAWHGAPDIRGMDFDEDWVD